MDEIEAELGGPSSSPLENLLVERIVICWLQNYLADLDAVQKDRADSLQASHAQRRQSAAQARYLAAIKQLAVVRRLLQQPRSTLESLRTPVNETGGLCAKGSIRTAEAQDRPVTRPVKPAEGRSGLPATEAAVVN
jgi:hypothetical protein